MSDVGFAASIASLAVSCVAIFLSVYFYRQSKDNETTINRLLADIGSQTRSLERINAQQTQRLLETVSDIAQKRVRHEEESTTRNLQQLNDIIVSLHNSQTNNARNIDQKQHVHDQDETERAKSEQNQISGHNLPNMPDPLSVEQLRFEAISVVSSIYLYTGSANRYVQYLVPPREQREDDADFLNEVYRFLDASRQDFFQARDFLLRCEQQFGDNMHNVNLFSSVVNAERALPNIVRTSEETREYWDALFNQK